MMMASMLAAAGTGEALVVSGAEFSDAVFVSEPDVMETSAETLEETPAAEEVASESEAAENAAGETGEAVSEDSVFDAAEERAEAENSEESGIGAEMDEAVVDDDLREDDLADTLFTSGEESAFISGGEKTVFEDGEAAVLLENGEVPVYFDTLRAGDYTWIYTDEDYEININTDGIDHEGTTEWYIGILDDEGNFTDGNAVEDENDSITLNGAELAEIWGNRTVHVRAVVTTPGGAEYELDTDLDIREPIYDYQFPSWGTSQLPGWYFHMGTEFNTYVENGKYPYGENIAVPIEEVTVSVDEGVENAVEVIHGEGGWGLQMNGYGHAIVTMKYTPLEGSDADGVHPFDVGVGQNVYNMELWSGTETDRLLPGASLDLHAEVYWDYYDEENGHGSDMPNVAVKWICNDGAENITLTPDAENDRVMTVTANEDAGTVGALVEARAYLLDENGNIQVDEVGNEIEVAYSDFYINIQGGYHQIFTTVKDADGNNANTREMLPGETVTVTPELKYFADEARDGQTVTDAYRYRFWFDTNAVEIKNAAGNVVENDADAGSGPYTITMLQNWNTEITMVADLLYEDGNSNDHVAEYRIYTEEKWFDISYNNDENSIRHWDDRYTWVFENEDLEIVLNADGIDDVDGARIEWATDYEGEEAGEEFYTVSEDGKAIIIHGGKLMEADRYIGVQPRVMLGDICVGETDRIHVDPKKVIYDYQYQYGDMPMLPYWSSHIDKAFNCYVENPQYPWGENLEVAVNEVTMELKDGEENAIELIPNEDGWELKCNRFGYAAVTVSYTPVEGSGDAGEYTFEVYGEGAVYGMSIDSSTGTGMLLPGASLELDANVWLDCYEENRGHYQGDVSDVSIRWEIIDGADFITVEENAEDESIIRITANDDVDEAGAGIRCRAYLVDENGNIRETEDGHLMEVRSEDFWLGIQRDGYHQLFAEIADEEGNETNINRLEPGQSVTVTPQLMHFHMDAAEGEPEMAETWYRWDFDTNAVEIKDAEGNVMEPGSAAQGPFTVTKLQNWGTELRLHAMLKDEDENFFDAADISYWMDELDYSIWFDGLRDDQFTWVYPDEDLELILNTENLADKDAKVSWALLVYQEETDDFAPLDAEGLLTVRADSYSAVLHGAALDQIREQLLEESYLIIETTVDVNEQRVYDCRIGAQIRDTIHEAQEHDRAVYLGETGSCVNNTIPVYVENSEYPWGQTIFCPIQNIVSSDSQVISFEIQKGRWFCTVTGLGTATISITYEAAEGDVRTVSYDWTVFEETYEMTMKYSPDNTSMMLPGSEKQVSFEVYRCNADGERMLSEDEYTIAVESLNEDLITITEDGIIRAADVSEYSEARYKVMVTIPREGQEDYVIDGELDIYISDCYHVTTGETKVIAAPGETLTIEDFAPVMMQFSLENPDGKEIKEAEYQFLMAGYTEKSLVELDEETQTLHITAENVEEGDKPQTTGIIVQGIYTYEDGTEEIAGMWTDIVVCEHKGTTEITKAPTCTEKGVSAFTCHKCGAVNETMIDETGHDWGAWSVSSKATISAAEVQKRVCSVCKESETKSVGSKLTPFIKMNASSLKMKKGKSETDFKVTFANGDSVKTWKSSNKKIFTVTGKANGTCTIKAIAKGSAKLTATLASGKTKTITVTVVTTDVATTKISGVSAKATVLKGKTLQLKPTLTPFTSTQKITYKSSNKSAATVSSAGKITAKGPGTAKITVTSGSKTATCTVTVPGITNVKSALTVAKGKTVTLSAKKYGISSGFTYTTSDKSVATVTSKGKIKGIKPGKATITVAAGSYSVKCTVTVPGIGNVKSSMTLNQGKTSTLSPKRYGTTSKLTYSSPDKSVATVSSKGKITAKGPGKATITVKSGTYKATCTVTVPGIAGVKSTLTVKKGKTAAIAAKKYGISSAITYTTSNASVATVTSKGKITAKAAGKTTITVTAGDFKKTCVVTVPGISNVKSSLTLAKGAATTLSPKRYGVTSKVTYSSSNKSVATVSSKGKITAKKKGTATITVKAGSYSVKCKVTVQ